MSNGNMICAGVDISKETLDIVIHPYGTHFQFDYSEEGLAQLDACMAEHQVSRVGFEATGGYERPLMAHLRDNHPHLEVGMFQPLQIHAWRTSRLKRAKTDKLDASLIAEFTAHALELPRMRDARFDKLLEYLTFLEQIEERASMLKNMLESTRQKELRKFLQDDIKRLTRQREQIMCKMFAQIAKDEMLSKRFDLLVSIKGIGERSALAALIRMPELGQASNRQIAALAGVAPFVRQSGKSKGMARIGGGRSRLRKSMYMAAFAAARHNPQLSQFYKRLREAGKPHNQALTAVMRKLIILANVVITRNRPWVPELT